MVRHYQQKTDRGKWSPESMKLATDAVIQGEVGYKNAANSLLEVLVGSVTDNIYTGQPNPNLVQKLGSIKTVFLMEEEAQLVEYVLKMEE